MNVSSKPASDLETTFDEGGMLSDRVCGVSCPKCERELVMGSLRECQFAGCDRCGGMLIQQDVFATLIQHLRAEYCGPPVTPTPLNPVELGVDRECPACGRRMETHPYGGAGNAVIDSCSPCGVIWFDRGELTALVRAPGAR